LLGTYYGGDGRSTFGLPNLQGSVPVDAGQGPGTSQYVVGQTGGEQTVTLLSSQLPAHTHGAQFSTTAGSLPSPTNNAWAKPPGGGHGQPAAEQAYSTNAPNAAMSGAALSSVGGGLPHNNMSPYLVLNFVIAMVGIFPARS
jgi:microcystin-dependent protein